jgi:uncharacterized protein GlcG (DUF336 family)
MAWFKRSRRPSKERPAPLALERLESRTLLDATASLNLVTGLLSVTGTGSNSILVLLDPTHNQLVVSDGGQGVIGRFNNAAVKSITIDVTAGTGTNTVRIDNTVVQGATINGGGSSANDYFYAGGGMTQLMGGNGTNRLVAGSAATALIGGAGSNLMIGGPGIDTFTPGSGSNIFYNVQAGDTALPAPNVQIVSIPAAPDPPELTLTTAQVQAILQRAAGASANDAAIVTVVDRAGNLLGVLVENGVSPVVTGNINTLDFSIDGAISLARTAAFFSNDQAPLTSRTIQFISQSTITQREVDSNPNPYVTDPTVQGPGLVAPVEIGGNFPPNTPDTPQVDLFEIELSNRDSLLGGAVPNPLAGDTRFNATDLAPGVTSAGPSIGNMYDANFAFPVSYGELVGNKAVDQNRGIGTLPGGIPIYEDGQLVGGIGVFFPGTTGYASAENSALSTTYNPKLPDLSEEAEYIAFAAAGGTAGTQGTIAKISGQLPTIPNAVGTGFVLPSGRIDLAGITLDIYGPGGTQGVPNLLNFAAATTTPGNPNEGTLKPVDMHGDLLLPGIAPATGTIVEPHAGVGQDGVNLTASDVQTIINQAVAGSNQIRAQIRLPLGSTAKYVIAITDLDGNVIGLYRQPDATVFSEDIAVAKARNAAYYANPAQLQPEDETPGVPVGTAFTGRTFRYLAEPFYPEGINGQPPGPFSILNDGGVNTFNAQQVGPPLPKSAFQSVLGYDAFNPETNFHATAAGISPKNQNGVVFFPGSIPLYKMGPNGQPVLVGGLGISGDGVDEDDLDTFLASAGYMPPSSLNADNYFVDGARLPFQSFDRNPEDL